MILQPAALATYVIASSRDERARRLIPGRFGGLWSELRWAVRSRWLQTRGLTGDFKHGEVSDRSRQLTELWERKWPGSEPLGYLLPVSNHDRWVRFHSLPEFKRYAETPAEYEEVVRRHRAVLAELLVRVTS